MITTYARPDSLALLLDDIEREQPAGGVQVRIYDDATPSPSGAVLERVQARGWTYRRAAVNHGKRGWWRWWNTILEDLRRGPPQLYYILQDDMRLCERFFERSAELWSSIDDPLKASLDLHVTAGRDGLSSMCWTPVRSARVGRVVHCGWVDCAAFMCDRRLFEGLGWRLQPIPDSRWQREDASSGVGQQISVRAHKLGLGMYRVEQSLTVHDGSPSLMSPEARRRWPMETAGFVDGDEALGERTRRRPEVFASLATIPRRLNGLLQVVEALLPQVDRLGVYLNEYERVPSFLDRDEVVVARSQEYGVRADAGKFFWAGMATGYHLVCDDDIAYPQGYVDRLVEGIERYGRRAVVGFHGRILRTPVADYHASRLMHFSRALANDAPVHVLGTGVAGYHASALDVWPKDFLAPNMADVWLALLGQRQRVPFVCLRRAEGWLSELPGFRDDSIYVRARRRASAPGAPPGPETLAVREHGRWELQDLPGIRGRDLARRPVRRVHRPPRPRAPERQRPRERPLVRLRVAGPQRTATLVLPEHDHITQAIQHSGTYYERDLLEAIRELGARGTFVDVGAHYGNHTAFFALECDAELVVAIEPSPAAYAGLLETIAENGLQSRVATHRVAVHPVWRHVALMGLPWRPRKGAGTRSNSGRVAVARAPAAAVDAAAAPLDEILDGIAGVAVLKVDANGLSSAILASGRRMLRRDRPLVAAEATSDAERHALRALLSPLGYRELGRYCWTPTWLWAPRQG